jgi:pimeloyl-ACP methyl ester carboxylesterase
MIRPRSLVAPLRALACAVALVALQPAGARACPGDCGADDSVSVDELIRGVSIALGLAELDNCPAFDVSGDGHLSIDELIAAVNALLDGCPLPTAVVAETIDIPSDAAPADTPGSPGVAVLNPNLITQLGPNPNLNQARYTRFHLDATDLQPDAILILVPGFEAGANTFKILAENLLARAARERRLALELWAYDRRTNQLEDLAGADVAEMQGDAFVALDWLYGGELGLPLSPALAGLNRRAIFHNTQADIAFLANWTGLVFSRDIDAIVARARTVAKHANVFLGGHSAGTGFTARYAATDFNLTGGGAPDPGYAKLRGLVLLEGGGGSLAGTPTNDDALDRIIAKADGGLFGAVRDNAPRCVDGTTPCTIASEATDCAGQVPPKCTLPTTAYAVIPGLLNPRILASVEVVGIQGSTDPNHGQALLQVEQGAPGNAAVTKVADLGPLALISPATVYGSVGSFLDDDGVVAAIASFVATSIGGPGPVVDGLLTWKDISGPLPPELFPDNGPAPTALPPMVWGHEKEVTRFDRLLTTFFTGRTNFTDWYFPSAGLSTTSSPGVCTNGTCTAGNVGGTCAGDAACALSINLDSTALSLGRGRPDIENLTQVANVDIPVICFGGTNGLTPVPASYLPFAQSIGACTAPSCSGAPRVVDATSPNPAFPTFGDVAGGFEVHMNEGYAHVDVVSAEDDADNHVVGPLIEFLARNAQ